MTNMVLMSILNYDIEIYPNVIDDIFNVRSIAVQIERAAFLTY